jgi:hypothetical protein
MLTLSGLPLDDPAGRFYPLATSRVRNPPAVVVSDVNVPGQHGMLPGGNGVYGPGSVILNMRVRGGSYSAMMASYSALMFLVGLRRVPRTMIDTELNQMAAVQLVSVSDLEQNFRQMSSCTVTFSVPRAFWEDTTDTTVDLGTGAGAMTPSALVGGSAPILAPVFAIVGNGASTDFRVSDSATGTYFRFVGNVPAGQSVRIEPDTASAWLVSPADPWNGGTDVSGLLTIGPGQFVLSPGVSFLITKTGSTQTQLRARRAYL